MAKDWLVQAALIGIHHLAALLIKQGKPNGSYLTYCPYYSKFRANKETIYNHVCQVLYHMQLICADCHVWDGHYHAFEEPLPGQKLAWIRFEHFFKNFKNFAIAQFVSCWGIPPQVFEVTAAKIVPEDFTTAFIKQLDDTPDELPAVEDGQCIMVAYHPLPEGGGACGGDIVIPIMTSPRKMELEPVPSLVMQCIHGDWGPP